MAANHGKRPPDPRKVPRGNGRRPSPPPVSTQGHGRKPPPVPPHSSKRNPARGKPQSSGCCYAGQALKAVWAGKFRLARRFARLDLKTRLGVI